MAKYDYDIGVIGGGSAGLTLTAGSAMFGAKTVIIEKEERLGGDCLHYGCEPSKTLIKTAIVYHYMRKAEKYGLPPVQAGPVDFKKVSDRIRGVIETIQVHDSVERFCGLGAKVEFGEPKFVDDHQIELDGKRISAEHWCIATGGNPSAPPIPGLAETPYITNKEIFYMDDLPASLIVLGGGPIAIEMAQAMQRLGCDVTVIQRSGQIMTKEDKDMADMLMHWLEEEGVSFHLNTSLKEVKDHGDKREVFFEDADGNVQSVVAQQLLVALGRTGNHPDLALENAGVEYDKKGVKVDHRLRTTTKHIFAAGDSTGENQFTHAAGYEGSVVFQNVLLKIPRSADYTYLPWCTYAEPELGSIGMNETEAKKKGIEHKVWIEKFEKNDRALAEGEGRGLIKMVVDGNEKVLGVQVLGMEAGNLINEWVAILNSKGKLRDISGAVHPYPTLAEINKRVIGDMMSPKLFGGTLNKVYKYIFNLRGSACELPKTAVSME